MRNAFTAAAPQISRKKIFLNLWNCITIVSGRQQLHPFRAWLAAIMLQESGWRLCIATAFKFILHHASKLLDHTFLQSSEGLCRCANSAHPLTGINQSIPRPGGGTAQRWYIEPHNPRLGPIIVGEKKATTTTTISHRFYPTILVSSLQLSDKFTLKCEGDKLTRQRGRRCYQRCCERRVPWIITYADTCL